MTYKEMLACYTYDPFEELYGCTTDLAHGHSGHDLLAVSVSRLSDGASYRAYWGCHVDVDRAIVRMKQNLTQEHLDVEEELDNWQVGNESWLAAYLKAKLKELEDCEMRL